MPFRRALANLADLSRHERGLRAVRRRRQAESGAGKYSQALFRATRFESFEERLAFSAQAVFDSLLDEIQHDALLDPAAQTVQQSSAASTVDYGLDYVRRTYGFLGAGQTVAIIDSGIAYDHAALGAGLGANYRVVGGWDFAENDADPYDDAPGGFHGTHVAGIVGSDDLTHRGVAPGADLVALRVFDDRGVGEMAWVEQALRWVHQHRNDFDNPITVVNLSLGSDWNGTGVPPVAQLEDELALLARDGIFITASAGNSFARYGSAGVGYPAASPYVTPVASVGASGTLSDFSQRSSRVIAAPGERITSTVPDYAYNLDGVTNDFERSSGTSMASPYVAGAGVLVREAMAIAGRTHITPGAIYDVLYSSADLVFDPQTSASYHRINVGRAIDAVMPDDDYGSTVATAFSLGAVTGDRKVSGLLGRTDDVDYFRFTAGQTGTVHFRSQETGALATEWRLSGGTAAGAVLSMEVMAGRTYAVGIAARQGIGRYDVSIELTPAQVAVDWGVIEFKQFANQRLTGGEAWRTFEASRSGILTIEAFFAHAAGNVDLELYDAQGRILGASRSTTNNERLNVTVTAGQTLSLKVIGSNNDVDFRLTNLVRGSSGVIDVFGTAGDDRFTFVAGSRHVITVNGVRYVFGADNVERVRFRGEDGRDTISLRGSAADERLTARPGGLTLSGDGWKASAVAVEQATIIGGGGRDVAVLYGSDGDDRYDGRPDRGRLIGPGFDHRVLGFDSITVRASAGNDTAVLYGSDGDDRYYGSPARGQLIGPGYYHRVLGFNSVVVRASAGSDVARFIDSAGNDVFVARPELASLRGADFKHVVYRFDDVRATATAGYDRARFYDGPGADSFYARPGVDWMRGPGYLNYAKGFDEARAFATGGHDLAWLWDSPGNDRLQARPGEVRLVGAGFDTRAAGFDVTRAASVAGGYDRAVFFREAGDEFSLTRRGAVQQGDEHLNLALRFERVDQRRLAPLRQLALSGMDDDRDPLPLSARSDDMRALGQVFREYDDVRAGVVISE